MKRWTDFFKKVVKTTSKKLVAYDNFGIPITVNYKGEDTYKTWFGAICTFSVWVLMFFYVNRMYDELVNRIDPARTSYRLKNSHEKSKPLNMPESGDQMYIGLIQKTE